MQLEYYTKSVFIQSILANKQRTVLLRESGQFKLARRAALRRELFLKQKGRCIFCNKKMYLDVDVKVQKGKVATFEHVIPKSQGGGNKKINLKISCSACNNRRQTHDFTHYFEKGAVDDLAHKRAAEEKRYQKNRNAKRYLMLDCCYRVMNNESMDGCFFHPNTFRPYKAKSLIMDWNQAMNTLGHRLER